MRELSRSAGARLMTITRSVIRDNGKQELVARALGISDALLSQALNAQRVPSLEWAPTLLAFDHQRRIIDYLAYHAQCRAIPIEPLTAAQKYPLLIAELKRAGADVEAIEKRAYQEDEP